MQEGDLEDAAQQLEFLNVMQVRVVPQCGVSGAGRGDGMAGESVLDSYSATPFPSEVKRILPLVYSFSISKIWKIFIENNQRSYLANNNSIVVTDCTHKSPTGPNPLNAQYTQLMHF